MPFRNPVAAGLRLIREALRSDPYVPGTTGWSINRDGTAEFSDLTLRGTFRTSSGVIFINADKLYVLDPNVVPPYDVNNPAFELTAESILGSTVGVRMRSDTSMFISDTSDDSTPIQIRNGNLPVPVVEAGHVTADSPGGVNNVSGSVVFLQSFPAGVIPRVSVGVQAFTGNTPVVVCVTAQSVNGFNWRYMLCSNGLIPIGVGAIQFDWTAIAPDS